MEEIDLNTARQLAQMLSEDVPDGEDPDDQPGVENQPQEAMAAGLPKRIGVYRLIRLIARGGMADVFEAQHPVRGRCALKVVLDVHAKSLLGRRLLREAEFLRMLEDPGIARVLDVGEGRIDDTEVLVPFVAMELIPKARPINTYAAEEELTLRERVALVESIARALGHAHLRGIIHRDLKPGNLLVSEDGVPKIIDFGIGTATQTLETPLPTMQTMPGQLLGTLQYMSPEQVEGDSTGVDVRSDVYSLGIVLYELLTQRLPYSTAGSPIMVGAQIIRSAPIPRPRSFNRAIDRDLESVVLKALSRPRQHRYQSMDALREDLALWLAGKRVGARVSRRWLDFTTWLSRHPVTATATLCGLMILVSILTSFGAVRYVNSRPDRLTIGRAARIAQIRSLGGSILHQWSNLSITRGQNRPAVIVKASDGYRTHKLVAVCFRRTDENDAETIRIYSMAQPERALWTGPGVTPFALYPDYLERDINPITGLPDKRVVYLGRVLEVADVFPSVPGEELISIETNVRHFPTAIRIYSLNGLLEGGDIEVLYEVWHPGHLTQMVWIDETRSLIVCGGNNRLDYQQLGESHVSRRSANVVFALKPRLGFRDSNRWLTQFGANDPDKPVWYRVLTPTLLCESWSIDLLSNIDEPTDAGHDTSIQVFPHIRNPDQSLSQIRVQWYLSSSGDLEPARGPLTDISRRQLNSLSDEERAGVFNIEAMKLIEIEMPAYTEVEPDS